MSVASFTIFLASSQDLGFGLELDSSLGTVDSLSSWVSLLGESFNLSSIVTNDLAFAGHFELNLELGVIRLDKKVELVSPLVVYDRH